MNHPSDVEKLSSDKRLAWRALSTLGTQLFLMDPALSVEEAPSAAGMPTATVTFSIPNGHTLAKGPTVAMGMLSNHADLLHSYCDEEGCICMEFKSRMDGGRPFMSAPPFSVLHGMLCRIRRNNCTTKSTARAKPRPCFHHYRIASLNA